MMTSTTSIIMSILLAVCQCQTDTDGFSNTTGVASLTPTPSIITSHCSPSLSCPTTYPVCCGTSEGFTANYCAKSGSYCCDFPDASRRGSCPLGSTCCLARDGSKRKSCCNATDSCQGDGTCAPDPCKQQGIQATCLASKGCGWCCGTGECSSTTFSTCSSPPFLSSKARGSTCPDQCNTFKSCMDCKSEKCGWCSSKGQCETIATSKCNMYSFIYGNLNCTDSLQLGLVFREYDSRGVTLPVWVIAICLAGSLIATSLIIFLVRRVAIHRQHAMAAAAALAAATVTSVTTFAGVIKYGFGSQTSLCEVEDEILELSGRDPEACVVCLDNNAAVSFTPCKHFCCCVECSLRLESSPGAKNLLCPLCRTEVVTMINVMNKSFGAPSSIVSPTEPLCVDVLTSSVVDENGSPAMALGTFSPVNSSVSNLMNESSQNDM